jgi:hypothetical protein
MPNLIRVEMSKLRLFSTIVAALLLSLTCGCDNRANSQAKPDSAPPTIPHAGVISGRVTFAGPPPRLPRLPVQGDPHCMQAHPDGLPDEAVVVADDGAVANVFVFLRGGPRWDGSVREPALLDQVGCQYHPHAVGVQINQPLRVKNSDGVYHNVHLLAEKNPSQNQGSMPMTEVTVHFDTAEILHTRCDVHSWMHAYIGVFENPYFAVTGADGKFALSNVPPGSYTLTAWHERFGELTKQVTVAPDGTVKEDFVYAP